MTLKEMRQTRRAGLLNVKEKGMTIGYEQDYEQVFGNIFERRESKFCAVLMKHRRKVKGEQVLILQMDQQLKTKKLVMNQDNYFVVSVKINFCQRQTKCIDDQDKFQSVAMNSLNVKHQGKSSDQLAFHLSTYTHL